MSEGKAWVSSVAREKWADWCLCHPPASTLSNQGRTVKATIEFEKHGNALCVFVRDGEERIMTREVQWVFCEEMLGRCLWVGVYVCRPDANGVTGGEMLEVGFEEFVVETE